MNLQYYFLLLTLYLTTVLARYRSVSDYVDDIFGDATMDAELGEDSEEEYIASKTYPKHYPYALKAETPVSQLDLLHQKKETLDLQREAIFGETDEEDNESFGFCYEHLCHYERPVVPGHYYNPGVLPFANYHHKPTVEEVKQHLRKLKRKRASMRAKTSGRFFFG